MLGGCLQGIAKIACIAESQDISTAMNGNGDTTLMQESYPTFFLCWWFL
jgi:hypothetical protein